MKALLELGLPVDIMATALDEVVFIENYPGVLPVLKKNLADLKSKKNYEIVEKDIYKSNFKFNLSEKFDLIFLDPPYKDKNLQNLITKIYNKKILKKNGVIIIHRHKKEKDEFPEFISIVEEKNYGISKIIFLSYV
mgnify:CR=1 FL=1